MLQAAKTFVQRIWILEKNKYQKMGLKNIALAYLLLYLYFVKLTEYMKTIWPANIQNKLVFQVILTLAIYILSTPLYFLVYLPGYLGASIYKQYQIEPNRKWPWELQNWKGLKQKTINNLLLNNFVIFPAYILLGVKLSGATMIFQGFPTPFEVVKTCSIILVCDDALFMLFHSTFHKIPFLYKQISQTPSLIQLSLLWNCTVRGSFGIRHRNVSNCLLTQLPGTLTYLFYRPHIYSFGIWTMYKLYNSNQGHCGYEFPWSPGRALPFVYGASYHDFHHSANVGNYATRVYLVQMIFGGNKEFFDRQIEKIKAEEAKEMLIKAE